MGCCLATPTAAVNHRHPPKTAPSQPPPPTPPEEETVKEVLSETPIVPKTPPPVPVQPSNLDQRQIPHPEEPKIENDVVLDLTKNEIQENVSEISEMYSYSESFSAATTATTVADANNKRDEIDDGEVTQKLKNKSPPAKKVPRKRPVASSGEFAGRKERATRPAARRQMAPSPEKKRQSPSRTTTNGPRHRNVGTSEARREVTARRSRSPAVRGEARQVKGKCGVKSPVKVVESEGKSTVEKIVDGRAEPVTEPEVQVSESLENPLVSMECFIFL